MSEETFRALLRAGPESNLTFVGAAPDAGTLDAAALGRLMADAWRSHRQTSTPGDTAWDAARALLERAEQLPPRYSDASALEALETLVALAGAERDEAKPRAISYGLPGEWPLKAATGVLQGLDGPMTPPMKAALSALVRHPCPEQTLPFRAALAAVAGGEAFAEVWQVCESCHREHPLCLLELRLLCELGAADPKRASEAAQVVVAYPDTTDDQAIHPPGEYPLAFLPGFVEAARGALENAAAHVAAIQAGEVPYAADKAFARDEARPLARFAKIALDRDEPWLAPLLEPLLLGVALAPDPAAKTAPSQSAAIQIAKAIAERPTTPAVLALKRVAGEVRHAGVKKKIGRLLKTAERRLYQRPDFILSLPAAAKLPKALHTPAKRALEALYRSDRTFDASDFEARFLENKTLAEMVSKLVWTICKPSGRRSSAMPAKVKGAWRFLDASGDPFDVQPGDSLALWHPLVAPEDECDAWRTAVIGSAMTQPFNQVFRETYSLPEAELAASRSDVFKGIGIDRKTVQGLALASGWCLSRYDGFQLTLRPYRFCFDCGELYPGMEGATLTGDISASKDGRPVSLGAIDPVLLSEVLRSADLLTSVAAFALKREDAAYLALSTLDRTPGESLDRPRLGERSAQMRREVLRRLFGDEARDDAPWVEGHYLRRGGVSIHIATGIARRDGKPLEPPKKDGPTVLPYGDDVLERIIVQVNALD